MGGGRLRHVTAMSGRRSAVGEPHGMLHNHSPGVNEANTASLPRIHVLVISAVGSDMSSL